MYHKTVRYVCVYTPAFLHCLFFFGIQNQSAQKSPYMLHYLHKVFLIDNDLSCLLGRSLTTTTFSASLLQACQERPMIPPRAEAQSYSHNDIPWQSTASWEANTGHPDKHNQQTNSSKYKQKHVITWKQMQKCKLVSLSAHFYLMGKRLIK